MKQVKNEKKRDIVVEVLNTNFLKFNGSEKNNQIPNYPEVE